MDFAKCRNDEDRFKHCCEIMRQLTPNRRIRVHVGWSRWWTELEDQRAPGWARRLGCESRSKSYMEFPESAAQQVALDCEDRGSNWVVVLNVHPADTISQAKQFYASVKLDRIDALLRRNWEINTNFHLAHIQRHMLWVNSLLSLNEYLKFWCDNQDMICQLRRNQFEHHIQRWLDAGVISKPDVLDIKKTFNGINNATMNPCPGISLKYTWASDIVLEQEKGGSFSRTVKGALSEAFLAWGQSCQEFW